MTVSIQKAGFSDLDHAVRLDKAAFAEDSWGLLDFVYILNDPHSFSFSAFIGNEFAGFASVERNLQDNEAWLTTIAVHSQHRRSGIGTVLLEQCEKAAGNLPVFLTVDAENPEAIRFYENRGYRRIGLQPGYYLSGHDAYVYKKEEA